MFSSVPTERIGGGDGDGAASGLSAREGPVSSPRGLAFCVLSGELFGLRDETDDSLANELSGDAAAAEAFPSWPSHGGPWPSLAVDSMV